MKQITKKLYEQGDILRCVQTPPEDHAQHGNYDYGDLFVVTDECEEDSDGDIEYVASKDGDDFSSCICARDFFEVISDPIEKANLIRQYPGLQVIPRIEFGDGIEVSIDTDNDWLCVGDYAFSFDEARELAQYILQHCNNN